MVNIVFVLVLFYLVPICTKAADNDNYERYSNKDAMNYALKGISKEFQIDQKLKTFQARTTKYIRNNVSEYGEDIPTFLVGAVHVINQKGFKFKGKTPIIGNRYEFLLKRDLVQIRFSGVNPFITDSDYWLLSNNTTLECGLLFSF